MDQLSEQEIEKIVSLLKTGKPLPEDYKASLFDTKKEYELMYAGKEREEDILADTMAVPLQKVKTFRNGKNGKGWTNMLIFGDNLQVLKTLLRMKERGKLKNDNGTPGVQLVCIDPPFASKQDFRGSEDQKAYQDRVSGAQFLEFLRKRLVFLRELLSEDGAIYVHLDQKKMHYVKTIMDEIFGESRLRNELIWHYKFRMMDSQNKFNKKHDTILFYARTDAHKIEMPKEEWTKEDILARRKQEVHFDPDGREWVWMPGPKGRSKSRKKYLDEIIDEGKAVDDVWDMPIISSSAKERTGYPTQKPEHLVARFIKASSKPGDIVLDAFVGSGTACAVAEKLGRRWIGIDCGKLAIYTTQSVF